MHIIHEDYQTDDPKNKITIHDYVKNMNIE